MSMTNHPLVNKLGTALSVLATYVLPISAQGAAGDLASNAASSGTPA